MTEDRAKWIRKFVNESWAIEGLHIVGPDFMAVVDLHHEFLERSAFDFDEFTATARALTWGAARVRNRPGMNVRVGTYVAPPGGPDVQATLHGLLIAAQEHDLMPFALHREFEDLHPFMGGNGRAGRLLWAWMMEDLGHDPAWRDRGFLHTWYYQSLEHHRCKVRRRRPDWSSGGGCR